MNASRHNERPSILELKFFYKINKTKKMDNFLMININIYFRSSTEFLHVVIERNQAIQFKHSQKCTKQ